MTMFDSYDNPSKIGTCDSYENYKILNDSLPNKVFNIKGNFVGYSWHCYDIFDWEISINRKILVKEDSIIYSLPDEMPDTMTRGYFGQQAYNVRDIKSWTCVGLIDGYFIWVEDKEFIYCINGTKEIELIPDMLDKTMSITFYDNKWNTLVNIDNIHSNKFSCKIGTTIKELQKNGIYYVTTRINDITKGTSEVVDAYMITVI